MRRSAAGLVVVLLALASAALAGHGGVPSVALTEPDYLKWLLDSRQRRRATTAGSSGVSR